MSRAHDSEVAVVKRRDVQDAKAFGCRDDGCVDRSEREIVVTGDELGNTQQVRRLDGFDREVPGSEIAEEPDFRLPA